MFGEKSAIKCGGVGHHSRYFLLLMGFHASFLHTKSERMKFIKRFIFIFLFVHRQPLSYFIFSFLLVINGKLVLIGFIRNEFVTKSVCGRDKTILIIVVIIFWLVSRFKTTSSIKGWFTPTMFLIYRDWLHHHFIHRGFLHGFSTSCFGFFNRFFERFFRVFN